SQQSPQRASPGWQCCCFLATEDHFSSSWTSWVVGGKSHQLVVSLVGMGAGPQGVAHDGVFIDARQACRLADATALLEVGEDSEGLAFRQSGGEQGSAFALGETCLTGTADEQAPLLARAIAEADAEVVPAP